jgi:ribonuclease HIII
MAISSTLGPRELQKLKGIIIGKNLRKEPTTNEYELLRIKDGKVMIIVYTSGKIVYENNPETLAIIDQVFINESKYDYELGTDEVGKGEWYGPLIVACVALKPKDIPELRKLGVKDSKLLSDSEILRISHEIKKRKILWRTLVLAPTTYNEKVEEFKKENKNINELLAWSHSALIKAILKEINFSKVQVVIDKFDAEKTYRRLLQIDKEKVNIIQKTKGESEIPVAAASILAKNLFNEEVSKMSKSFGIDFKHVDPKEIPKNILKQVAKLHFKNISEIMKL